MFERIHDIRCVWGNELEIETAASLRKTVGVQSVILVQTLEMVYICSLSKVKTQAFFVSVDWASRPDSEGIRG